MLVTKVRTLFMLAAVYAFAFGTLAHAATLELVSSVPINNAIDVSRTGSINLQFSTTLNARSVNAGTITLQSAAGNQKISLSTTGTMVSVRPSTLLLPWTNYTLNVSSVMSTAGEQLAAPISISFKTLDASWQAPQVIDRLTSTQWNQVTATNAKGVRFVAWLQANDANTGDDIWAIRYVPGVVSTAVRIASFERIASYPENYISELNVFVDEDGNAFTTWVIQNYPLLDPPPNYNFPPAWHLWATRFVTGSGWGSGWGTPQIIDGYSKHSATNLHLVFDHTGNAFALWQEFDCCGIHSQQSIVATHYTQAGGWGDPIYLDGAGSFDSFFVGGKIDIQLDNAGNAYATWTTLEDLHYPVPKLFISYYKATMSGFVWTPRQMIATESTMNSTGYQALAVNPRGDALLMWADDSGLKFAHTDELGRWSKPVLIDSSVTISPSQVVLLDSGEAFAAFINGVKIYTPRNGLWSWTHPLLTDQNASSDPRLVVDLTGNALVAWTQNNGGVNRIYAKRYRADRGWFSSLPIDSGNTSVEQLEELFLEPSGSVVAAWGQSNDVGTVDIQAAHFE